MATILQTDFFWPDVAIERAGHRLVTGPSEALAPDRIEALVGEHDPETIT